MKRPHRTWHLVIWMIVAPLVAIGLYLAIAWRPPLPVEPQHLQNDLVDTALPSAGEAQR